MGEAERESPVAEQEVRERSNRVYTVATSSFTQKRVKINDWVKMTHLGYRMKNKIETKSVVYPALMPLSDAESMVRYPETDPFTRVLHRKNATQPADSLAYLAQECACVLAEAGLDETEAYVLLNADGSYVIVPHDFDRMDQ